MSSFVCSVSAVKIFHLLIIDAPITVGLQNSYYSADESSGDLEVCVEITSGEVDGRTITLSYETINGLAIGNKINKMLKQNDCLISSLHKLVTAAAPSDFSAVNGNLTITEDDTVDCVSITIINDNQDEDDRECFAFAISTTTTDGVSLKTSQATICITDDDGIPTCYDA